MADSLKVSGVRLVVEGADEFQSRLKSASSALTQNAAEMRKLEATYGKNSTNSTFLAQKQALLTKQLDLQRQRTQALRDTLAAYQKTQDASPEKIQKMNLAITQSETLEAGYARQLQETGAALEEMGKSAGKAQGGIKKTGQEADAAKAKLISFGDAAIKAGDKINKMGGKMTRNLTLPIIAGFTYAAKEVIQFEDAFAGVVKTFRGSQAELEQIQTQIIDLSGSGLVTQSKEQISVIAAMASQLGIQTPNIIGFSTAMLQLADATNLGSEDAAQGLAQFANITGMAQSEFSNLGSAIVALGNNSATQEDAIVNLGMRLAAAGTTAGLSVADIMGISAAFASVGMEAEAGGTAVSKLMLDMDMSVAKGAKATEKYAKIAGMTAKEFQALWKQDAAGGFTQFIQGLQRIQAEGGNVALTLEQIGIKDVRMRDAMLRAVNAGDLLGASVSRANSAYAENTALAEEAAAKNTTFAARMKVVANRFDNAAMSLGESMMPLMEKGMDLINNLVSGFGNLGVGSRQAVVGIGLSVAALGPLMKVAGNVTKAVGFLSKGIGLLGLPGGPVLAAVAGFGLLAFAMANIKTPLEQIHERMRNLDFEFDEVESADFSRGIEKGIEAANKEYTVKAKIKVEMEDLETDIDAAMADGKMSGKERKGLKKQLDDLIKADIDAAQIDLQTSVNKYVGTLAGLKNANGENIFSESELAQFSADLTTKTNDLTAQLEGYQAEYNLLMDTVYKQQKPMTTQQMAEMNALLAQIAEVRAQIQTASDEALASAKMMTDLTMSGQGNAQTAGAAAGYIGQTQQNQLQQIAAEQDAALAAVEASTLDADTKLDKSAEIVAASTAKAEAATAEANQSHSKVMDGIAKQNAELAGVIQTAADSYDTLKGIEDSFSFEEGYDFDSLNKVLTPEVLAGIGEGYVWNTKSMEQMIADGDPIGAYLAEMQTILSGKIAEGAEAMEGENPLTGYLKSLMEKDIKIDPTLADGVMEDILKVLDFAGKEEEFGLDFSEGIGKGMTSPEAQTKITEGTDGVKDTVDEGAQTVPPLGTKTGNALIDFMIAAMLGREEELKAAAAALGSAAGITIPITFSTNGEVPNYNLPGGDSTGGGETDLTGNPENGPYQQISSVFVNNMNVRKDSDIYAIGAELDAATRRRQRAYG